MIMGGNLFCDDPVWEIKRYDRRVKFVGTCAREMIEGNVVTELTEHEKKELGLATQRCIGHRNNAR